MSSPPPRAPGHQPGVGHNLTFLRDPLGSLQRWGGTDEPVQRLRLGGRTVCLVSDAEPTRTVLAGETADYRKAEIVRERLGTLQGGSLVLLEGTAWRDRRSTLQSGFTRDRVAAVGERTTEYATEMVDDWPTDRPVRVEQAVSNLTLSLLAKALFGLDLRGERTPIHEAADDILARMDMQSVSTFLPEWVPTPRNRRFRRAVATLHDRLDAMVAERATGEPTGDDLLSTMLAAGLPAETIRDELIAFLFAGFDSTATALSCTLGLIGGHPRLQTELQKELDGTLDGDAPTPGDLPDLPLLDAVVSESLRLYPPQYVLFREPESAVSLAGYVINAGTTVVLSPWVLHRDERLWTRPSQFRPSRWLGEADIPEQAYLPYGAGPRHCLGARLADQTLKLVVATVCQRRELTLSGGLSVSAGPTLSLDGGVQLFAERRSSPQ